MPVTAETPAWEITAGMGIEEVGSRDMMGSPLAYRGLGYPVIIRGEVTGSKWSGGMEAGVFSFGFNGGRLGAALGEDGQQSHHHADSVFVDLSAWTQRAVATPSSYRLSLGMQISHWTFFRSYTYNPAQIGSVETWDAVVTTDARAELMQTIHRFSWQVSMSLAIGGRMMRPSHSMRGDERIALINENSRVLRQGQWATINRLQMMQTDATIAWAFTERWAVAAQYRIGMLAFRDEMPTRAYSQRATVGMRFRF